jgi:hypothetical protein
MPLTLSNLKQHVQHSLGGTPSDQISEVDIINQAGRHMFTHGWKFRDRPTKEETISADNSFVTLPGDVGEIISIRMKDGLNDSIQLTSYDHVLMVRNGDISTGAHYYATVVWPEPWFDDTQQYPRIEIAPTPTADDTITIAYRSAWIELVADGDIAQVPPFAEALLIAYVRAFSQGYEEEGMAQRLVEVELSPVFQRVAVQDGMIQNTYGEIRGGMVGRNREGGRLPFDSIKPPGWTPNP